MNREELARTLPSAVLVAAVLSAVAPPGEAGGSPPEDARLTVPFLLDCGPSGRERDDEDEWRERRRRTAGIRTLRDRRYSRRSGYGHEGGEGFRQWFAGVSGIWGRVEPDLYASGRHAPESYLFDLPAGDYVVALGFCELEEHRAGRRVFDIVLQGDEVARGFDIFAAGGYSQAIHRVFPARVRQGERLTVVLRRAPESARAPQLNTIRVHPLRETGEPPPPPEDLRGVGSYSMNVLFWSHPEDERVAGYVVERRAPGEEEFSRATREPVPGARWMDEGLSPGKAYRYRVASVDFRGRRSAFSREVELRPRDPGDSPLPVYSLRVAEDDLNAVLEDVREDRVVAAKLEVEGKKYTVLFRVRGASTRNAAKLSYRLEFIGRRPPPGRRVIYLKGEPSDHTLQQEKLTCDLFTALGLPVSSARYVNLFLNGHYRGLYLDIDRIDTGFMRRRGAGAGTLFRASSFQRLGRPAGRKRGSSGKESELDELIRAVNRLERGEFLSFTRSALDLENVRGYLVASTICHRSEIEANDFFYFRDAQRGWQLIPWDHNNGNFGVMGTARRVREPFMPLYGQTLQGMGPHVGYWYVLPSRLFLEEEYRREYLRELEAAAKRWLLSGRVDQLIDANHRSIASEAPLDPYRWPPGENEPFTASTVELKRFARQHGERLVERIQAERSRPAAPTSSSR